ncbi:hypothetical protein SAMN05421823_10541 [Catalinimonas alkaloidigena]|uniref:Uncharacterized protein n=1 Tax=Catalinimonas alkaloidigena TaxID=1075417 RepID=A0A1G9ILA3_9BACT|nr:hypothetical protein [Catalinimonas alkaloidigena]SDL26069.1 hypothetical protein SAMN05421823_10541 [Catalinimonas alkaloidigena]
MVWAVVAWMTCACDQVIRYGCGELTGERKAFVERLNASQVGRLEAAPVPCYDDYLEVRCQQEIPAAFWPKLDSLAAALGWQEVLVYDRTGTLIRGHTGSM